MRFRSAQILWLILTRLAFGGPSIDLSSYDPACGVAIHSAIDNKGGILLASWNAGDAVPCALELDLDPARPLIKSVSINRKTISRALQPVYQVTIGQRKREALNARYTFFDHVFKNESEVKWSESVLQPESVRIRSAGSQVTIEICGLSAGLFHGSLQLHLYAGSPLLHLQAVMTVDKPETAYSYEFVLQGAFDKIAWSGLDDPLKSSAPEGPLKPLRVRYRTILGQTDAGTVAVFPPPHAYLYPKDEADNFGFVQAGSRGIGIRQPVTGVRWSPLFDAPPGQYQRMGVFLLLSAGDANAALEGVKRYTHADTLKEIEGYTTLITHEHAALTVHDRTPQPRGPAFVRACKNVNVKIIQLAEFHGDGLTSQENGTGSERLNDYRDMYATCRKYSDDQLIILPGEEPDCAFPGHWIILFPKPVYFTRKRAASQPFKEDLPPYGLVYHLGTAEEAHQMLVENHGLAWTAHPRVKGSRNCPDQYKDTAWYQSPQWLGATWKAMPADLSQPRLGTRCLDLLDDMNLWGQRKFSVGEFDCFRVDDASEFYGNLNASYLHLARRPTVDDWSPVLDCLRSGDFFVSTGEVLIHSWKTEPGHVTADVEWSLPLAHAEVIACDGRRVERQTVAISDAKEFGRRTFDWPVSLPNPKWVRIEVWDVADDGAFTQPRYLGVAK